MQMRKCNPYKSSATHTGCGVAALAPGRLLELGLTRECFRKASSSVMYSAAMHSEMSPDAANCSK